MAVVWQLAPRCQTGHVERSAPAASTQSLTLRPGQSTIACTFHGHKLARQTSVFGSRGTHPGRLQCKAGVFERTATVVSQPGLTSALPVEVEESTAIAPTPVLSGAGGGIFFFWQLGVVKHLQQKYDLRKVAFVGASAGALLVTLAACEVDSEVAVESAHRLALDNRLFERPLGLAGVWGNLIRDWLDEILPENAAELCSGRVKLVATEVPSLRLSYLENFATKEEVIDACMASVHIPFLLDWQPCTRFRDKLYLDGSFRDFVTWSNSELVTVGNTACVLDYSRDELLSFSRLDFVKLRNLEQVLELMQQGMDYAQRVDAKGEFDQYFQGLERPWYNAAAKLQKLSSGVLSNILPWAARAA